MLRDDQLLNICHKGAEGKLKKGFIFSANVQKYLKEKSSPKC